MHPFVHPSVRASVRPSTNIGPQEQATKQIVEATTTLKKTEASVDQLVQRHGVLIQVKVPTTGVKKKRQYKEVVAALKSAEYSECVSIHPSVHPSVRPSIHPSTHIIHPSTHPSIRIDAHSSMHAVKAQSKRSKATKTSTRRCRPKSK